MQPTKEVSVFLLLLGTCGLASASDAGSYFISARSGMINHVEGRPTVVHHGLSDPSQVFPRDQLVEGDLLQTGRNERVEILFNPGSYLRVAQESRVRVLATAFEDMRFALEQGTAILESLTLSGKVHGLVIVTPIADLRVLKKGLYRFAVDDAGYAQVSVSRGKLRWVQGSKKIADLKSGRVFDLGRSGEGKFHFAKLSKNERDELDRWSRRRAQILIGANAKVPSWITRTALSSYGPRAAGGWVYEPFSQMYTFVPFHYRLTSPYGLTYRNFCPTSRSYAPTFSTPAGRPTSESPGWSPSTTRDQRASASRSSPGRDASATGRAAQRSRSTTRNSVRRK